MNDDEIRWITINGQHVPIHEGESKREAVSKFISSKKTRKNKVEEFKRKKQSNNKIDTNKDYRLVPENEKYINKIMNDKLKRSLNRKKTSVQEAVDRYNAEHERQRKINEEILKHYDEEEKKGKIKKFVKKGNTYIPIRENENEKDVVKSYSRENDKERMNKIKDLQHNERLAQMGARQSLGAKGDREVAEAESRRGRLIKYTLENKDKIKKWADEYDDERNQRAYEKTKRGEGLTKEEYFGFLARGPKEGDLMLTGEGAKRVGRNGSLEDIQESEYRDNVYVGKQQTSQVKVKGENNIIPRDFKKAYGKFKIKSTANSENQDDRFEITKDDYGRYLAKNLRTGETYQTFLSHLRNNNVFEFENEKEETIRKFKQRKGK